MLWRSLAACAAVLIVAGAGQGEAEAQTFLLTPGSSYSVAGNGTGFIGGNVISFADVILLPGEKGGGLFEVDYSGLGSNSDPRDCHGDQFDPPYCSAPPYAAGGGQTFTATNIPTNDALLGGPLLFDVTVTFRSLSDDVIGIQLGSGPFIYTGLPEPATWAMMLAGFAMVGAGLRYRRKSTTARFA